MSSDEAREIVAAGLENRKAERQHREQEQKLESYEQDMMAMISEKSAKAKEKELKQKNRETVKALAAARRQEQKRRDAAAEDAVKRYGYICLAIFLLATWTPLPWYGAAALVAGLGVFPAVYIFRLYYPL